MSSLAQLKQPTPRFKHRVILGTGDKANSSTAAFVDVDGVNLAALTLDLAVGDVVRCELAGTGYNSSSSTYVGYDFLVDRPVSADIRIGGDGGVGILQATLRTPFTIVGRFTATEAGVHGFRPQWKMAATGTANLVNQSSGLQHIPIGFTVENVGVAL